MKIINNKFFRVILPNIVIVITFMMITLLILDYYNPLMGFLKRGMSVGVIVAWIVAVVVYVVGVGIRKLSRDKSEKLWDKVEKFIEMK